MNKKAMDSEEGGWEAGNGLCWFFITLISLGLDTYMSLMHSNL